MPTTVLAVDCGATSVRVCAVDLDERPIVPVVLHRVTHGPVQSPDGSLRWDWPLILDAVEDGLRAGLERGPVASIGIDTWGVDYGLLGPAGALLSPPHSYRSDRTRSWRDTVDRIGETTLYETTGIQLMPINTIFQLAAHDPEELASAGRLLMLPELLVHHLTGAELGEVTSAGTTALVDLATGSWSTKLLDAIDVDPGLMPPIHATGTHAGSWQGVPVHLVAGHDTACAVATTASDPAAMSAFVATGTWFLVGALRDSPNTTALAQSLNFTNEPAAFGGVRLLKNVVGFSLLERCREEWGNPSIETLLAEAAAVSDTPVFDPGVEDLSGTDHIESTIRRLAGLPASATRGAVVRCIIASLASATARVLGDLSVLSGVPVQQLHVIGGGVRNELLLDLLARHCKVPIMSGPAEAAAVGNALIQGVAIGRFTDLAAAQRAAL